MILNFFKICPTCKKKRFYLTRRKFHCGPLHTDLTSEEEICSKCLLILKKEYEI